MDYLPNVSRRRHPQEEANFFSKLFFLYTLNIFVKGYQKEIRKEDLSSVPSILKSKNLGNQFEELWNKQQQTKLKKPSLLAILIKAHGTRYILLGLSQVIFKTTIIVLQPFLVGRFSLFFAESQTEFTRSEAYFCGLSIIIVVFLENIYDQWYLFSLTTLELKIRASLTSASYKNILLSSSLDVEDVGKTITLITKDVRNLEMCVRHANETWISTIQSVVLFYLLLRKVGFVVLILVVFFIFLLPIQAHLATKCGLFKKEMLIETDNRFETLKDVLANLKMIKMYSWEKHFQLKLSNIRSKELHSAYKIFLIKSLVHINGIVWICATFAPLMAVFIAVGQEVKPETAFFIFDSYRTMGYLLTITLPLALIQIAEAVPSLARMDKFLQFKYTHKQCQSPKGCKIFMKDGSVTYRREQILSNLNLEFDSGLVLITGGPNGGKSFLLKTILGDCDLTMGQLYIEGTMSYASQEPWIFPATIRQNILFGEKFDQKRYKEVLTACVLSHEFERFEDGDYTIIGTNKANLSKSLLVRINLARAVYKNSDVYLLDDPLEALDPCLAEHVFQQCIVRFLGKSLVILAKQKPDLFDLLKFKQNVVLEDGEVVSLKRGKAKPLSEILHSFRLSSEDVQTNFTECDDADEETKLLPTHTEKDLFEQHPRVGKVESRVYTKWMTAGGGVFYFCLSMCFVILLPIAMKLFEHSINSWSKNEEDLSHFTSQNETQIVKALLEQRKNYVALQIIMVLSVLVINVGANLAFLSFCQRASMTLCDFVTKSLINIKIKFFNTSWANISNRLSRDLLNMDEVLPFLFYDSFKTVVPLVAATILIVQTQKILLVSLVALIVALGLMRKIFVAVARNLKRLEASTLSPVISYFGSTLNGLTTIKSQKAERIVQKELNRHLDLHFSVSYTYLCVTTAFCLFLRLACTIFLGIVVHQSLLNPIDSRSVSILMFQSLFLVQILSKTLLNWAETETYMTAVERILELTETEQESKRNFYSAPKLPEIRFSNVSLSHDTRTRPVLQDLKFFAQAKAKVGIVGRSGSGKSSIFSALLNVEDFEGKITIGGIDSRMLEQSSISVIPQKVVLFRGSVRENLDPYYKHTDMEIWDVLERVNLKRVLWDLNVDIYSTYITCNSKYIQLFCLAKVMIEKNNIVLVDNLFTNIDEETEDVICDAIKNVFEKSTMLIVSHNMRILGCCDEILVFVDGRVVKFGTLSELTKNEKGTLFQLMSMKPR